MTTTSPGPSNAAGPVDVLLVHVPKLVEWSPLYGWSARVGFLATGMLSLAEHLDRHGVRVRIVDLAAEKWLDPRASLVRMARDSGARVVAFSLHWHPQSWDTLEAARQLREAEPDIAIVLGGLTASLFAGELLRRWPCIDAVVRGEAEVPLLEAVSALLRGSDLSRVPNLSWRDGGSVRENPASWCASAEDLDGWSFARWDLVAHAEVVQRLGWVIPWAPAWREDALRPTRTWFGLPLGRGCTGTCAWCAGSRGPTRRWSGRGHTSWRSPEAVAGTVASTQEQGIEQFYACFDPHPSDQRPLVAAVRALGSLEVRPRVDLELFGLPSPELVRAVATCLAPGSRLILSPETADESLRRRLRAFPFTNAALEDSLARCTVHDVPVELYLAVGLPGESAASAHATAGWARRLMDRYRCVVDMRAYPVEMEPGSPWSAVPGAYGLRLHRATLDDLLAAHARPDFSLGYDTDLLEEREILDLHRTLYPPRPAELERTIANAWSPVGEGLEALRHHV